MPLNFFRRARRKALPFALFSFVFTSFSNGFASREAIADEVNPSTAPAPMRNRNKRPKTAKAKKTKKDSPNNSPEPSAGAPTPSSTPAKTEASPESK